VKMLLVEVVHLPTFISLGVIAAVLAVTILASLRSERRDRDGGPGGDTAPAVLERRD
jgi:hypothetical protein